VSALFIEIFGFYTIIERKVTNVVNKPFIKMMIYKFIMNFTQYAL
jgi:hypothetical protein